MGTIIKNCFIFSIVDFIIAKFQVKRINLRNKINSSIKNVL